MNTLTEYPETKFITFEQSICAVVNGRRVPIAIQRGAEIPSAPETNDQETYNLIQAMTKRATLVPELLAALEAVVEWIVDGSPLYPGHRAHTQMLEAIAKAKNA